MRKTLVFCLLIISIYNIDAQDYDYDTNGFSVGIVPSALLNIWTGFQGKVEYGFKDNFAVDLNVGYLYGRDNDGLYSGVRIRPSFRYYFNESYIQNDKLYGAVGYLYRDHNTRTEGSISRSGGQYFERVLYTRATTLSGIFAMFGGRTQISDRFWIDGGIGLGSGILDVRNEGLQPGEELTNEFESIFNLGFRTPGSRRLGIIIAHFSICVSI